MGQADWGVRCHDAWIREGVLGFRSRVYSNIHLRCVGLRPVTTDLLRSLAIELVIWGDVLNGTLCINMREQGGIRTTPKRELVLIRGERNDEPKDIRT